MRTPREIGPGPFEITWDPRKAAVNLRKHRVSFEEGASVWFDRLADYEDDALHAGRCVLVGASRWRRVLVTVFAEMTDAGARIISARRATRAERRRYEEGGRFGDRSRARVVSVRNPFWRRIVRYGIWIRPQPGAASRSHSATVRRVARDGYVLRPDPDPVR